MNGYEDLTGGVAAVRRSAVGLVSVAGPDAASFLQSLVSQDIDGIEIGETRHSLLLEPQGKLIADFHVARVGEDEFWLRCEPPVAPLLTAGLTRFKIRVKVEIDDRSPEFAAVTLRGPETPGVSIALGTDVHAIEIDWAGVAGRDLVGPSSAVQALDLREIPEADEAALDIVRIEARIPRQPDDIDDRTIAQEAMLHETAVSFTKGCFVGQELICRIDSRGRVNRTLRRLQSDTAMDIGADVTGPDGKVVGAITSSGVSPRRGPIALATLRREILAGSTVHFGSAQAIALD